MDDKLAAFIFIVFFGLFILGGYLASPTKTPKEKQHYKYEERIESYVNQLETASPAKSRNIKSELDELISEYKTWFRHNYLGSSSKNSHKKIRKRIDELLEEYRDYKRIESRTN